MTGARTGVAVAALVGVVALLASTTAGMDVANAALPWVLAVAPAAVLVAPVVTGRVGGLLPGALVAVAVALAGGADVVRLGLLGTLLLVLVGVVAPDPGLRPLRRVAAAAAIGSVATGVVALATTTPPPPAALALLAGVVVAVVGVALSRRLARP